MVSKIVKIAMLLGMVFSTGSFATIDNSSRTHNSPQPKVEKLVNFTEILDR